MNKKGDVDLFRAMIILGILIVIITGIILVFKEKSYTAIQSLKDVLSI
jgi:hypothetical protein